MEGPLLVAAVVPKKKGDGFFENLLSNLANPLWRGQEGIAGTIDAVAFEVVVGRIGRWLLGLKCHQGWVADIMMYSTAEALYGGVQGNIFDDPKDPNKATFMEAATDAAKAIPAVWLSQYIVQTGAQGLHLPKIHAIDLVTLAATKVITRPLIGLTTMGDLKYLTKMVTQHNEAHIRQKTASRVKTGTTTKVSV